MRALFVAWNAWNDPGSGAARSFRTMARILADGGHQVVALTAAEFEGLNAVDLGAHLGSLGLQGSERYTPRCRTLARYKWEGVDVNFICTEVDKRQPVNETDTRAFLAHVTRLIREYRPQVVATYGSHPALGEARRLLKQGASRVVMHVLNFGYEKREAFLNVDRVTTNSAFLQRWYGEKIGLRSHVLYSPVLASEVVAESGSRDKVLFVNPTMHKGRALVARMLEMLAAQKIAIPFEVIVSDAPKAEFRAMLSPEAESLVTFSGPYADPKEFWGRAKIAVVPSVIEAFGRVAVEAVLNGVPVIGPNMGGVPEAMGEGGIALPIPKSMATAMDELPSEEDALPWVQALVDLWFDEVRYQKAQAGAAVSAERWSEEATRARVLQYFEGVAAGK